MFSPLLGAEFSFILINLHIDYFVKLEVENPSTTLQFVAPTVSRIYWLVHLA